uniref:Protein kinase domain-containing protein n=1 Tax=Plectus sambesii TaxID=2011161 RepID=A0A914WHK5_9BILA
MERMATLREGTLVNLPKGELVNGRFCIVRKVGEGGCGAVYEVFDQSLNTRAALKAEANDVSGGSVLKLEVEVLKRLRSCMFVPHVIHSGKRSAYSYVVMTLLGPSLQHLWKIRCAGRPLSESTTVRIGIQALLGIKQLHDVGFVHRDIKPTNFAMALGDGADGRFVHLIDFGLARAYVTRDANGEQIIRPPRPDGQVLFRGTIRYCSPNTLLRKEQGRHDDIWSLMYMLVEISGGLPWSKTKEMDREKMRQIKQNTPDSRLLKNRPAEMYPILDHLRTLDYMMRPNYAFVCSQLCAVMSRKRYNFADPFDWESSRATNLPAHVVDPNDLVHNDCGL